MPVLPHLLAVSLLAAPSQPASVDEAAPADVPAPGAHAEPSGWKVPAAHAGGVLVGMRVALGVLWPEAYDPSRFRLEGEQLRLAYTRPPEFRRDRNLLESDGDPWWLNGFGHGLFGSEIYGRTRQCGHGPLGAFLATAAVSVAWEYGLEAPHKRPSGIDLVWTPIAGGLLGEGRYRLHRWLKARGSAAWLLFAVDPLGETERRFAGAGC